MPKLTTGRYERTRVGGEEVAAFVQQALPPTDPPVVVAAALTERLRAAEQALVRLELAGEMLPSFDWFIYAFVRKKAVLPSQIEGTQATLVDLLTREAHDGGEQNAASNADVEEVCNYLDARAQLADPKDLPRSMRLLSETHQQLMRGVRGADKLPGDVRRSQTVGNPHAIGEWLHGSSGQSFKLVDPPKPQAQRDLRLDLCADIGAAAMAIGHIARGNKSLVFVESRSKAEKVAHALAGTGVEVFIHHSSVSRADRTLAEEQFAKGQNTAIVCTSTMELDIDVGDLDQVIQADAPASVASFLQRLGRTVRRSNTRSNCTFFCLSPESLLQSVALLRLAEAGWVEDVTPAAHAMHMLAHQVMALILQEGGISRHKQMPWVEAAYQFSSVRAERVAEFIDTMLEREILHEADGLLALGARGEKLYGKKNFFELYAVFTVPPVMRVQHGKEDVGYIQALFVTIHDHRKGPLSFRLSGRAWEVGQIDWGKGVLHVHPTEHGRVPSWLGFPGVCSNALCKGMRDVLIHEQQEAAWLSKAASAELAAIRDSYDGLLQAGTAPIEDQPDGVQWHTFAGDAVNCLLAVGIEQKSGKKWVAGNLLLKCKDIAFMAAGDAILSLANMNWERVAAGAAREMAHGMLSKFQPCLPEEAEDRLLSERLLDQSGTLRFLASVKVNGTRIAALPTGLRLADVEATGPLPLELAARPVPRPPQRTMSSGWTPRRRSARSARSCAVSTSSASTSRPRSTSAPFASLKSPRARGPSSATRWPSATSSPSAALRP